MARVFQQTARSSTQRLSRLAISADGFFHCSPFVAIALCERFCPLGVLHIPGLPGGNPCHHWRPRRLSPRRLISRSACEFHCPSEWICFVQFVARYRSFFVS